MTCLFVHFHLVFLSFYGKQLALSYKSVVVKGAVMECLAVTEELLAKDCSFRPLPGGLLLLDDCAFISSAVSPGLTLAFLRGSPWSFSTMAH